MASERWEIAGVVLEDQEDLQGLVHTILSPSIPIEDVATGQTYTPADDLTAAVALQLGLVPSELTEGQRGSIEGFIFWVQTWD